MGMDSGAREGKAGRARPNMNVTPLVDVVLVLLIIFMVITPLLAKQFWLTLPDKVDKHDHPADPKDTPIVLRVTSTGEIRINSDTVPKTELQERLHRMLAAQPRIVFFDADEDAPFGVAVETMDLARAGGAATIAVLTEPLPDR